MNAELERQQLQLSDQVRRYVRGTLDAAELSDFETRLMSSPALQDQVEAELALKEHAAALAANSRSPWNDWLPMAACLVLGTGTGYGIRTWESGLATLDSHALTLVSFVAQRNTPTNESSAPGGRSLALRFLTADDVPHEVRVLDRHGQQILHEQALLPDTSGQLYVWMPAVSAAQSPLQIELYDGTRRDQYSLVITP